MYNVYVLENDSKPVYIGMTSNIQRRLYEHIKNGKTFTGYKVIFTTKVERDALLVETHLIKFISNHLDDYYNASEIILLMNKNI